MNEPKFSITRRTDPAPTRCSHFFHGMCGEDGNAQYISVSPPPVFDKGERAKVHRPLCFAHAVKFARKRKVTGLAEAGLKELET